MNPSASRAYRRASRHAHPADTIVRIGEQVTVGGDAIPIIAGPCAVESRDQILEAAHAVREAGASILRGGAFKPRSSPYAFQGIGEDGLALLAEAREATGLPIVTEAVDPESVAAVETYADMIQIGSRNMQNYSLLRRVGHTARPVMLKRGAAATIDEWLSSAEYILDAGNPQVILCERGIRGFDPHTRNVLDLASVPATQALTHLPVMVDPSHGTGRRDLVIPAARAAVAAGADALMVEVHPDPDRARSDGAQSLAPEQFAELVRALRNIAEAIGRTVPDPAPVT